MSGEWIEWNGGKCPVDPYECVSTRFRDGRECDFAPAFHWVDRWSNRWEHTGPVRGDDIIAYRSVLA